MKIMAVVTFLSLMLVAVCAWGFTIWVNGVEMRDVKWLKIETQGDEIIIMNAPTPISQPLTPNPRDDRWYPVGPPRQ